jgi:ketosteroid isomerase-like protein
MKKYQYILILAMMLASCQTKTIVMNDDMTGFKEAVNRVLDAHWSAVKAKDADAVIALVTDDFLSCGTDSKEFWNSTEMYNSIKQMFKDPGLRLEITIDKRVIRIARDGNSAIAFEQMFLTPFSAKVPVRTIYHLVKEKNTWLIDFAGTGFIPDNEDIDKINKALEQD